MDDHNSIDDILKLKEIANNYTKNKEFELAYTEYIKIRNIIQGIENRDQLLNEQLKLILSNIALVTSKLNKFDESIQNDKLVIKMDSKFHKSYARLASNYLEKNDFVLANYYFSLIKYHINSEAENNYPDLKSKLETEKRKRQPNPMEKY